MSLPFEELLIEKLFPDILAWSYHDSVASYVMHRGSQKPLFFRKLNDEVLEYALAHEKEYSVFSVKTDGGVDDVTEAWTRVFEKHKVARGAIDDLLAAWTRRLPNDVATMEVKTDGMTLGYFPKPSMAMLRCVDLARDVNRLTVLVIHTTGVVEDATAEWQPFFKDYVALRG